MKNIRRVTITLACALIPSACVAMVIDDFSVGPFQVLGPAELTQYNLPVDSVFSGSRSHTIGQSGTGSLLAIADGQLRLEAVGEGSRGYFTTTYELGESAASIDLTADGANRFRLRLGEINSPQTPIGLYVDLPVGSSGNGVTFTLHSMYSDAIIEIPFSVFPVEMTEVRMIALDVLRHPAQTTIAFESIEAAGDPLAGDYNRDGLVDEQDLPVWKASYGIPRVFNGAVVGIVAADGNSDGFVNAADYTMWRDAYEASLATSATPEPSAATLFTLTGVSFLRRRRR